MCGANIMYSTLHWANRYKVSVVVVLLSEGSFGSEARLWRCLFVSSLFMYACLIINCCLHVLMLYIHLLL